MSTEERATLWQQVEKKSEQPLAQVPVVKSKTRKFPWYSLAASITIVLFIAGFWFFQENHTITTYHTAYGETRYITLPDGSSVTLNANSILKFNAKEFTEQSRDVWMQGEAFFEVNKLVAPGGQANKFIVHTDDLDVEVLGTQFNVNTRRTSTKVVLTEGKVRLNLIRMHGEPPVTMVPGEMVSYSYSLNAIKKENVNLSIHTAWKQQKLIFEDTPVYEIIDLLEDNYGLKINLQNKEAAESHYTGTFQNPDPDTILMVLSGVLNLELERHGQAITLK